MVGHISQRVMPIILQIIITFLAARSLAISSVPALIIVPDNSAANVEFFESERAQLSDEIIDAIAHSQDNSLLANLVAFDFNSTTVERNATSCKTYPGDASWPADSVWADFDALLGGGLLRTIPIASPCYDTKEWGPKNVTKCHNLTNSFRVFPTHENDPTSIMWPIFQGKTCMAKSTTSSNATCTLGSYPVHAVNVSSVAHIQLAVNLARNMNIRLVVKNTGHDYLGKSSGAGSLGIWTHNLKSITFFPELELDGYNGPAFKVGAGVTALELYRAAEANNVTVLGSIAPSVGFAGGYIQGGGHTPLSGLHGMAADAALAFQVVTADGKFVTASATSHTDLFWALRGGGGGTFGVVTSVVVKAFPQTDVTFSTWTLGNSTDGTQVVSRSNFLKAVRIFWEMFPVMTDARTYSFFFIFNTNGQLSFDMKTFFAPTHTEESLAALLKPFFDAVKDLNIPFTKPQKSTYHETFLPAYMQAWGRNEFPMGTATGLPGNRLIPKAMWTDPAKFEILWNRTVAHIEAGHHFGVYHQAPGNKQNADNAVSSAWRNAQAFFITKSPNFPEDATTAEIREANRVLLENNLQPWREITPASEGGGSYLNEAAVDEPNWKEDFYGEQYNRLLNTKKKVDPHSVFYATTGIGSDEWEIRGPDLGVTTQNGRLCRTGK